MNQTVKQLFCPPGEKIKKVTDLQDLVDARLLSDLRQGLLRNHVGSASYWILGSLVVVTVIRLTRIKPDVLETNFNKAPES